jgi:hypothetical protein
MQFAKDIEECIRNPLLVRKLSKKRKVEVLAFLRKFRLAWHVLRVEWLDDKDSKIWLEKRK